MSDILLQLIWVAAHRNLRSRGALLAHHRRTSTEHPATACWLCCALDDRHLWPHVHAITAALGNPPAPYMERAR